MDSWERFLKELLPDRLAFYSDLYLEDITDKDYTHSQKVFEEFNLQNLGNYKDFYVQSDTLLLAVVLTTLETSASKYMNLILLIFYQHQD